MNDLTQNGYYVKNCYNVGLARGTHVSGGIIGISGWSNAWRAVQVYNSFCDSTKFTYSHYYWNGSGYSISYQGVVPGDTIKTYANRQEDGTSVLGDKFMDDQGINNGYPILAWQVEATE